MKVIDVIRRAIDFVGDLKMEEILKKLEYADSLTSDEELVQQKYINGLNLAVDTIASRYYSSIAKTKVVSDDDSKIAYADLDERVYEVVKVVNKSGVAVEHYSLPFSLLVPKPNTEYEVSFKFLPAKVESLFDQVQVLPIIDEKIVAFLMASDLCLACGQYTESKFWFSEFERGVSQAIASRRMRTLAVSKLI